jgi:hypothetical protein
VEFVLKKKSRKIKISQASIGSNVAQLARGASWWINQSIDDYSID